MIDVFPFSPFPPAAESNKKSKPLAFEKIIKADSFFQTDAQFDWLYPEKFQLISRRQWTPIAVAKRAAGYLAAKGANVLDIGSGIGKFCLTAAHLYPASNYFGVEQRLELIAHAKITTEYLALKNLRFIHANITQIDFDQFDHFYFFNSFYENIDRLNAIDNNIETSFGLYEYYTNYLCATLNKKPSGTRLVTYQSLGEVVPPGYKLIEQSFFNLLKLWIKE
ncbi:methyltransferase domain-containing protein [Pedobacter sp. UYEF25]